MSQIASFTYLKESDIPFLGFWSKPKPRLFRRPVSKFDEFLRQRALREAMFDAADGVYVALVFGWFEMKGWWSENEESPFIKTVRNNLRGEPYWLFEGRHVQKILQQMQPFNASEWPCLLGWVREAESDFVMDFFEAALEYVVERFKELREGEALLVSIG